MAQALHIFIESFKLQSRHVDHTAAALSLPFARRVLRIGSRSTQREGSQGQKQQLVDAEVKGEGHGCLSGSRHGVKRSQVTVRMYKRGAPGWLGKTQSASATIPSDTLVLFRCSGEDAVAKIPAGTIHSIILSI
ncbi:unnamed protein product [Arctogadus glacialis]